MAATKTEVQDVQENIAGNNGPMIYQLVGKAMAEVDAIGKSKSATNYNGKEMYKFRGIDDVYNALNPVMAKYGLFIVPEVLDIKREERLSSTKNTLIYSIATIRFTMYAPDGSYVQAVLVGEGMDSGDKSMNKAMSIAMKYFCFQIFMIPTDEMEDPDKEKHEIKPNTAPVPQNIRQQASRAQNEQTPAPAPKAPEARAEAPAEVTTQPVVPPNDVDPVQAYINNEIAFMSQRFEISDRKEMGIKFAAMRKALIEGKVVPDIPSKDLTMDQAKNLIDAIYKNFMTDEEKVS